MSRETKPYTYDMAARPPAKVQMAIALRLIEAFGDRLPEASQIRSMLGCSIATAYRIRTIYRDEVVDRRLARKVAA